ncbi:MAG: hypothetical protein FH756_03210 [Firmicutes bacterium]|nr:hypothetical protein [Bacillota bacterium]
MSDYIRLRVSDEIGQRLDAVVDQIQRTAPAAEVNRNTVAKHALESFIKLEESKLCTYAVWFKSDNDQGDIIEVKDITEMHENIMQTNHDITSVLDDLKEKTGADVVVRATNKIKAINIAADMLS